MQGAMKAATAIGIGVAFGSLLLSSMMDGTSPATFINIPALIIILGGTGGVTLASVTPPVPPRMMINAGMLMNVAGLVPSIIELSSSEPNATPIPIAVAAFIAPCIGVHRGSFNSEGGRARSLSPSSRTHTDVCLGAPRASFKWGSHYAGLSSTASRCAGSRSGLTDPDERSGRRRLSASLSTSER